MQESKLRSLRERERERERERDYYKKKKPTKNSLRLPDILKQGVISIEFRLLASPLSVSLFLCPLQALPANSQGRQHTALSSKRLKNPVFFFILSISKCALPSTPSPDPSPLPPLLSLYNTDLPTSICVSCPVLRNDFQGLLKFCVLWFRKSTGCHML